MRTLRSNGRTDFSKQLVEEPGLKFRISEGQPDVFFYSMMGHLLKILHIQKFMKFERLLQKGRWLFIFRKRKKIYIMPIPVAAFLYNSKSWGGEN